MCKYLWDIFLFQFERCKQELERVGQETQKQLLSNISTEMRRLAYDSVVPNSLDQLPMVEEEEGKEAKPLDRTLSLESFIRAIEEEKNKTPRTERRLAGLKEALRLQEASNLSTQEAVSLVSDLGLSPPNSPGRSPSH